MIKKSRQDEKFKAKLNLAFFILYNFDPYLFYNLKCFPDRNTINKSNVLDKLKKIDLLIKKLSSRLIYQQRFLKEGELLKMKYFFTVLSNKKFLTSKITKQLEKESKVEPNFYFTKSTNVEETLKKLEDFLVL